jgi:hypothetical protein
MSAGLSVPDRDPAEVYEKERRKNPDESDTELSKVRARVMNAKRRMLKRSFSLPTRRQRANR